MEQCKFIIDWSDRCKENAIKDGHCEKHENVICVSCGKKATHTCLETMGLVCGAPLCDDCEHTIQDNGCNSRGNLPKGIGSHCRKDQQVYKPWYVQEYIKEHGEEAYLKLKEDN